MIVILLKKGFYTFYTIGYEVSEPHGPLLLAGRPSITALAGPSEPGRKLKPAAATMPRSRAPAERLFRSDRRWLYPAGRQT